MVRGGTSGSRPPWIELGAGAVGTLLGLLGAGANGVYLWSAIEVLDQADRSVVFWYAVFLLAGLALTGWAIGVLLWLLDRVRDRQVARRNVRGLLALVLALGGGTGLAAVAVGAWHLIVL